MMIGVVCKHAFHLPWCALGVRFGDGVTTVVMACWSRPYLLSHRPCKLQPTSQYVRTVWPAVDGAVGHTRIRVACGHIASERNPFAASSALQPTGMDTAHTALRTIEQQ